MAQVWNQRDEESFIERLGEHGPDDWVAGRSLEEKLARARGYLRALDHPRRWDEGMSVTRLRRLAAKRVQFLEQSQRLNGSG